MNQVSLHNTNIVVSIHGLQNEIENIIEKLSRFYNVDKKYITMSQSMSISTFFIRGYKNVYSDIEWFYKDNESFTACLYPVLEKEILKSKGGIEIKNILHRSKGDLPSIWRVKPPFGLFHHNLIDDSLECFNDFLGMGKIYTYSKNGVHIIGSSPLVVSLITPETPVENKLFWDQYLTFGGGIGKETYFRDIDLLDSGSRVAIIKGRMSIFSQYSYKRLLLLKRENSIEYMDPIQSGLDLIKSVKDYLTNDIKIGVSGGRDSRFIAALSVEAGLNFSAFTKTPPLLEAEIAKELFDSLNNKISWKERPITISAATPKQLILERSKDWFKFTSGDCWSTFMRRDFKFKQNIHVGSANLSGASGEIARGHDYTINCLNKDPSVRIDYMMRAYQNNRQILPRKIKENAISHLKSELFQPLSEGITGFYLLDYAFSTNRMRRQYPIYTEAVMPMFTAEMALETFWLNPIQKINGTYIMNKTNSIIPQWKNINYMHQRAIGTDSRLTNKTKVVQMLWENNNKDFLESMEYATNIMPDLELSIDTVKQDINELPEGRSRTSQTYQFIFWRAGFLQTLNEIRTIRDYCNLKF